MAKAAGILSYRTLALRYFSSGGSRPMTSPAFGISPAAAARRTRQRKNVPFASVRKRSDCGRKASLFSTPAPKARRPRALQASGRPLSSLFRRAPR